MPAGWSVITGQQRPAGIALLWRDAGTGRRSAAKLAPMHRTADGSCGSEKQHVKASHRARSVHQKADVGRCNVLGVMQSTTEVSEYGARIYVDGAVEKRVRSAVFAGDAAGAASELAGAARRKTRGHIGAQKRDGSAMGKTEKIVKYGKPQADKLRDEIKRQKK